MSFIRDTEKGRRRLRRNNGSRSMAKNYLVTGGAGFIGSHLCEYLLSEGHRVTCVDNFSTGFLDNIGSLMENTNFKLLKHDVCQPVEIEADGIFNLACPASPIQYQRDPIRTTRTNILGALNSLECGRRQKIPVLQTSTSEVYGDPAVHPQTESYWGNVNPIGRRACYDEGKRCAESIFFDYHRQFGVSIKVCRIFNTYGPRMQPADGRVVSNFLIQALQNQPITIYGQGLQTRSFCFIEDMVEALVRMMDTPLCQTGPINLGNPEEYSMLELVDFILDITGSSSEIIFCPLPEDDPRQRRPDISLARETLGWEPTTGLREGLEITADYFDDLLRQLPVANRTVRPESEILEGMSASLFGRSTL